jgi:hypothetical protein
MRRDNPQKEKTMKTYERPCITSQKPAMSVINGDERPQSKIADVQDSSSYTTTAGYEADE